MTSLQLEKVILIGGANLITWDTESLFEAIRSIFPSILENSTGSGSKRLIEIARLAFVSQDPGLP